MDDLKMTFSEHLNRLTNSPFAFALPLGLHPAFMQEAIRQVRRMEEDESRRRMVFETLSMPPISDAELVAYYNTLSNGKVRGVPFAIHFTKQYDRWLLKWRVDIIEYIRNFAGVKMPQEWQIDKLMELQLSNMAQDVRNTPRSVMCRLLQHYPGGKFYFGSTPTINADSRIKPLHHETMGATMMDAHGYSIADNPFFNLKLGRPILDDTENEIPIRVKFASKDALDTSLLNNLTTNQPEMDTKNTAGPGPTAQDVSMSKKQKRERIKELESALANLKAHRKCVDELKDKVDRNLGWTLGMTLSVRDNNEETLNRLNLPLYDAAFMPTKTWLKVYNSELDDKESELNAELDKLTA